jgi:hypothetical protein
MNLTAIQAARQELMNQADNGRIDPAEWGKFILMCMQAGAETNRAWAVRKYAELEARCSSVSESQASSPPSPSSRPVCSVVE